MSSFCSTGLIAVGSAYDPHTNERPSTSLAPFLNSGPRGNAPEAVACKVTSAMDAAGDSKRKRDPQDEVSAAEGGRIEGINLAAGLAV